MTFDSVNTLFENCRYFLSRSSIRKNEKSDELLSQREKMLQKVESLIEVLLLRAKMQYFVDDFVGKLLQLVMDYGAETHKGMISKLQRDRLMKYYNLSESVAKLYKFGRQEADFCTLSGQLLGLVRFSKSKEEEREILPNFYEQLKYFQRSLEQKRDQNEKAESSISALEAKYNYTELKDLFSLQCNLARKKDDGVVEEFLSRVDLVGERLIQYDCLEEAWNLYFDQHQMIENKSKSIGERLLLKLAKISKQIREKDAESTQYQHLSYWERYFFQHQKNIQIKQNMDMTNVVQKRDEFATSQVHLFENMISDCVDLIGELPCQFAVVAVNHLLNTDMQPFEFILLTSESDPTLKIQSYIKTFLSLFEFKVKVVGGLLFDEKLNPLKDRNFIGTTAQIFEYCQSPRMDGQRDELTFKFIQHQYIGGFNGEALYKTFQERVQGDIFESDAEQPMYESLALSCMRIHCNQLDRIICEKSVDFSRLGELYSSIILDMVLFQDCVGDNLVESLGLVAESRCLNSECLSDLSQALKEFALLEQVQVEPKRQAVVVSAILKPLSHFISLLVDDSLWDTDPLTCSFRTEIKNYFDETKQPDRAKMREAIQDLLSILFLRKGSFALYRAFFISMPDTYHAYFYDQFKKIGETFGEGASHQQVLQMLHSYPQADGRRLQDKSINEDWWNRVNELMTQEPLLSSQFGVRNLKGEEWFFKRDTVLQYLGGFSDVLTGVVVEGGRLIKEVNLQIDVVKQQDNCCGPGFEYAAWYLGQLLIGGGIQRSELLHLWDNNATDTSGLTVLRDGLLGGHLASLGQGEEDLSKRFSGLFLLTMLLQPGFVSAENLEFTRRQQYAVEKMSSNLTFFEENVKTVSKRGVNYCAVGVKSYLFCLDAMSLSFHPEFIDEFNKLDFHRVLVNWLHEMQEYNDKVERYFDVWVKRDKQTRCINEDEKKLFFTVKRGTITRMYEMLHFVKIVFEKRPDISHLDLLSLLDVQLGQFYRYAFSKYSEPSERFKAISNKVFLSEAMIFRPSIYITKIRLHQNVIDSIQAEFDLLKSTRDLLAAIDAAREKLWSNGDDIDPKEIKAALRFVFYSLLKEEERQKVIALLKKTVWRESLDVENLIQLKDVDLFEILSQSEEIKSINVGGCRQLTPKSLPKICGLKPGTVIATNLVLWQKAIVKNKVLSLTRLVLAGCSSLTTIDMKAPHLAVLSLKGCSALTRVSVNSLHLKYVNLAGCQKITDEEVFNLTQESGATLQKIKLDDCVGVTAEKLKSRYPMLCTLKKIPDRLFNIFNSADPIRNISLRGMKLDDYHVRVLKSYFLVNPVQELELLDLHDNSITGEGVALLIPLLMVAHKIDLSSNKIGNKGAQYIANILRENHPTKILDISDNSITDEGAEMLLKGVEMNDYICVVNLDANSLTNVTNDGEDQYKYQQDIARFLERNRLKASSDVNGLTSESGVLVGQDELQSARFEVDFSTSIDPSRQKVESTLETLKVSKLKAVKILGCPYLNQDNVISYFQLATVLTELVLKNCIALNAQSVVHLSQYCMSLMRFTLTNTMIEDLSDPLRQGISFPFLEFLDLSHNKELTTVNFKAPQVSVFVSNDCGKLNHLILCSKSLETVSLDRCFAVYDGTLKMLLMNSLPSIQMVSIEENELVADRDLKVKYPKLIYNSEVPEAVKDILRSNVPFDSLRLQGQHINDLLADVVACYLKAKRFFVNSVYLANNSLTSVGLKACSSMFLNCTELDLSGNLFSNEGCATLKNLLTDSAVLTILKVNKSGIDDAGVRLLSQGLMGNHSLQELEINDNHISCYGAAYLFFSLIYNRTLLSLSLISNSIFSITQMPIGLFPVQQDVPYELKEYGPDYKTRFIDCLFLMLVNNEQLISLNLRENGQGLLDLYVFDCALAENRTLTQLQYTDQDVSSSSVEYGEKLVKKLESNKRARSAPKDNVKLKQLKTKYVIPNIPTEFFQEQGFFNSRIASQNTNPQEDREELGCSFALFS